MNEQRGSWYLLTGLVMGLVFGLLFSWVISPVKYVDTEPSSLAGSYKDAYRQMIALAYQSSHDLARARERLKLIDSGDPIPALVSQAQRMLAENQQSPEARALALLATDLGQPAQALASTPTTQAAAPDVSATPEPPTPTTEVIAAVFSPTAPLPTLTPTPPPPTASPTITRTPTATFVPRATATTAATPSAPFALKKQSNVCDGSLPAGRLAVEVTDAQGAPLAGVPITISWKDGENRFFTGLAPEAGAGYADYDMTAGFVYTLRVGDTSELVSNLSASPGCAIRLIFSQ